MQTKPSDAHPLLWLYFPSFSSMTVFLEPQKNKTISPLFLRISMSMTYLGPISISNLFVYNQKLSTFCVLLS